MYIVEVTVPSEKDKDALSRHTPKKYDKYKVLCRAKPPWNKVRSHKGNTTGSW